MPYEPGRYPGPEPTSRARSSRSPSRDRELSTAGAIAEQIVAEVVSAGGNITLEDLRAYKAVVRAPMRGTYRGYEILSMPPPSSGGVHIVEILNTLEVLPIGFLGPNSAEPSTSWSRR